jgi:hypothetical protein
MLVPKWTVNDPPSAADATRSDAGTFVTTRPFWSRQDRVFSAE